MSIAGFEPGASILDQDLNCLSAPGEQFADLVFQRVDLCGAHLEQACFERCQFSEVLLTKALVNGAHFTDCTFQNCGFFRADMVNLRLIRCRFTACDFSWATLSDGYFEDVQFIDCATDGGAICDNGERQVTWQNGTIAGSAMLDHYAIAARDAQLHSQMLGRPCTSDACRSLDDHEGQLLLIDADGYHLTNVERGQENSRRSTGDVEELLFWFLEQTAFSIGCAHEFANRIEGPDFRRMVHAKQRELFARLGPEWRARLEAKLAATLSEHPYLDR